MKEFTIQKVEAGCRLDKYIDKVLPKAPGSFKYKMLRKKNITLNGKKAQGSELLCAGDHVKFFLSDETFEKFAKEASTASVKTPSFDKSGLIVLYEDDEILAFHKPVGLLSQKSNPQDISVNDYLRTYLTQNGEIFGSFMPSICNRLDRNTSGIILCGKSMEGSRELGRMLKDRSLAKYYECIVLGRANKGHIKGYLSKDEKTNKVTVSSQETEGAAYIETAFEPIDYLDVCGRKLTKLSVHLITGKTHQIRSHMADIGHPLIGDYKYGNRAVNEQFAQAYGVKSQLLHAKEVRFPKDCTLQIRGQVITDPYVPWHFA